MFVLLLWKIRSHDDYNERLQRNMRGVWVYEGTMITPHNTTHRAPHYTLLREAGPAPSNARPPSPPLTSAACHLGLHAGAVLWRAAVQRRPGLPPPERPRGSAGAPVA